MTVSKISHYSILERIGIGGMSDVYKAYDVVLNRSVVLKVFKPETVADESRRQRFLQEARAASALNHPNILTIYEVGSEDEGDFIATELVEGETLRRRLQAGRIEPRVALEIARQIAEALAVAHRAGIVHRDIKPENIMIRDDGYVKVLDFGLAKLLDGDSFTGNLTVVKRRPVLKTDSRLPVGTIRYMSPEQIQCLPVDHRCDLFSFGIILYEMFTGRHPFGGERAIDIAYEIVGVDPPLSTDTLNLVQPIISRCLEKNPAARYQDAESILKDLGRLSAFLEDIDEQLSAQGEGRQHIAKPVLIALGFENLNCDPEHEWLRSALAELLLFKLDSNTRLQIPGGDLISDILDQTRKPGDLLDKLAAFEAAQRCEADICVTGSFLALQQVFSVNAHLNEVRTGRTLCSITVKRSSVNEIFSVVDEIAARIERELKVASDTGIDTASLVTDSVEALRAFEKGLRNYRNRSFLAAAHSFEQAIDADPQFALAYFYLMRVERVLGRSENEAESALTGALERLGMLNERERLLVLLESSIIESDSLLEMRLAEEIVRQYPREKFGYLSLASAYRRRGESERAYLLAQKALSLDQLLPLAVERYEAVSILEYHFETGRHEAALELARRIAITCPENLQALQLAGIAAYNTRDLEAAARYFERAAMLEPTSAFNSIWKARLEMAADRYQEAAQILEALLENPDLTARDRVLCAADLAESYRERGLLKKWLERLEAEREVFLKSCNDGSLAPCFWKGYYCEQTGHPSEALAEYEAALERLEEESIDRVWAIVHTARMLAAFGRQAEAEALAVELEEVGRGLSNPRAERLSLYVRGCIEFHCGNYAQAAQLLDRSVWSWQGCSLMLRSMVQTLRQMKRCQQALDLLEGLSPYGSISGTGRFMPRTQIYLETAKTHEALGDKERALDYYRRCVEIWKDADAEFLGRQEAETGIALLSRS